MATLPPPDSLDASVRARIAALEAEYDAARLIVETHPAKIAHWRAALAAEAGMTPAMVAVAAPQPEATAQPRKSRGRAPTAPGPWSEFVAGRLAGVSGGMTLKEMTDSMRGTAWAEKHAGTRNGFYTAIQKLQDAGKIIRRDGVIYLPETLAKIDAGEIVEAERPLSQDKRGAYKIIERVVSAESGKLKAGDVVDRMREIPEAEPYLRRNTQLVYATLSRMAQGGLLERDFRGFYSIPAKAPPPAGNVVPLASASGGQTTM